MAQVTITKLVEGPTSLVVQVDLLNNDSSGELIDHQIISPADLVPKLAANKPALRIMQIWYGLVWFDVSISSGGVVPKPLWTLSRDAGNHIDFRSFGGLADKFVYLSPPGDDRGTILITTNGFATAGSKGSMILDLRKMP